MTMPDKRCGYCGSTDIVLDDDGETWCMNCSTTWSPMRSRYPDGDDRDLAEREG